MAAREQLAVVEPTLFSDAALAKSAAMRRRSLGSSFLGTIARWPARAKVRR